MVLGRPVGAGRATARIANTGCFMPERKRKMAKWFVAAKRADFNEIGKEFGISPVVARIIRNRDVVEKEQIRKYLYGGLEELYAPSLLKGMGEAAAILLDKIREKKPIRIIGDYDVDGVCSTFILQKGLAYCRARVDTAIPHRLRDGYGLNEHLVEEALADGIDTIVTCDNGIAAAPQIALAKKHNITVVVTDHHEVPYEEERDGGRRYLLPPADAVVDPKQPGCPYPFKEICGAVVAFKLVQELFAMLGLPGLEANGRGVLEELLEFAALATVCDVMTLQDENRILVKYGLAMMQNSQNVGLRALMEVNGILPDNREKKLSAFHLGFVIGPCMNASGRLDSATRALELLGSTNWEEAVPRAAFLKQLNDSRKEMTENFVREAAAMVENSGLAKDRVLVVFLPDCHESIAGIIAGRLRERYYKPVFVLTRGEEGVKGSGRSIETYHMYEEMTKCSHLFTRYGGHKMAAGLSMREEDVEAFRREINGLCTLTREDLEEHILIDAAMPISYVTFGLVEELECLQPFGTGNPKPVFAHRDLLFLSAKILGKSGNAIRFTVADAGQKRWEMMYFGDRIAFEDYVVSKYGQKELGNLYEGRGEGVRLHVIYDPGIHIWQGNARLQLIMRYYQ